MNFAESGQCSSSEWVTSTVEFIKFNSDWDKSVGLRFGQWVSECQAGKFSAAGSATCSECEAGEFSAAGSATCSECEAGEFSVAGSATCSECEAGEFSAAGSATCSECEAGEFSAAGSATCSECEAGEFSAAGSATCSECEAGEFSAAGSATCSECEAGEFSAAGSDSCRSCEIGKEANSEKTNCMSCLAGTYKDSSVEACQQCSSNTYSAESAGFCTACPQGSQANEDRTKCVSCESLPSSWEQIMTQSQFPLAPRSEVSLMCSTGHTLTGASTVTCIEEDDFSFNEEPFCVVGLKIRYDCSKLPNIQNLGTTTQFPVSYDTRVTVHCDAGYSLVGGDVITCIKDENYQTIDGQLPSCEERTCTELPIGRHLKTDSVFPVKKGAEIFVNCVEGFILTSGDRTITCVQDAYYISSSQLPTCIPEKCTKLPNIFDLKTSTSLPVDHGTIVEMDCIPGYSLSGSRLITCIKDKNWSYLDSPQCILELPAAVSDMITTSTFPVIVGTVVEVNCKPGHTLAGDNGITYRCTGMMIENYLSTDATFPITYGTAITVACDPEYLLAGSKVITCEKGIVYSHKSSRPQCVNPGE
ncbi:sushi, von Willebrand factor type A, EGF and pentraxin domain-containing protein 1-like [Bolinopsis microptera]|uniref:sushi, von Willebrand factor type A, EGF and pentraxin domain-containing protein 1-like n=1 Tax=Bolinopsis microptera TaxID=2820187 RepID=UPI003079D882